MKQSVNMYQFERAFKNMDRGEQFSYDGLKALYEYLVEYEEDTGTEVELDVIALCCEYAEYDSLEEFQADYGEKYESIEDISDETALIPIDDNAFIIQQF
jgi:hypothetical protein|tara:strand:+ start:1144 stop:1443 length:300 start_codon:yes stop_codon:yes gene_type:complete